MKLFSSEKNSYAIISTDKNGIITSINDSGEKMIGYYKEEILNSSIFDLLIPEEKEIVYNQFLRLICGEEEVLSSEHTLIHKSGYQVKVNIIGVPIITNHEIIGVYGIVRESMEYSHLEKNIINSTLDILNLINKIDIAILISDVLDVERIGRFIEVNNKACEILEYTREELLGKLYSDLIPPELLTVNHKHLFQLFKQRKAIFHGIYLTKSGRRVSVEINHRITTLYGRKVILSVLHPKDLFMDFDEFKFSSKTDPGKNLRMLMAKMDINTSELAQITGLSRATISNLRTGKVSKPNMDTAYTIAEALGVNILNIWPDLDY